MTKKATSLLLLCLLSTTCAFAAEGAVPKGVPPLQHVWVIMMENHGYGQIVNNPHAPFINKLAKSANAANNYYAVAHPSLTNYLEVVGGSNFGVLSDNDSDWHNKNCQPNLATGTANTDNPPSGNICPISGIGSEAPTPAIDFTNETQGPPGEYNIDGTASFPGLNNIIGKTIADQLVAHSRSWKSYQESLPISGPDRVNYADGFFSNLTDFSQFNTPFVTFSKGEIVKLYAAKHNPFVYFQNVQEGDDADNSLANVTDFGGLYADLGSGDVPTFSFIAPNQCNDQHARGNAGPFCYWDPNDDGSQAGLNTANIYMGDVTVQRLVTAIKASSAWRQGHSAIVVLWDENDYSVGHPNQVLTIVDTNYGAHGVQSANFYTHYSLLKSLEAGFGLPCLNHACDANVKVMTDLFANSD